MKILRADYSFLAEEKPPVRIFLRLFATKLPRNED